MPKSLASAYPCDSIVCLSLSGMLAFCGKPSLTTLTQEWAVILTIQVFFQQQAIFYLPRTGRIPHQYCILLLNQLPTRMILPVKPQIRFYTFFLRHLFSNNQQKFNGKNNIPSISLLFIHGSDRDHSFQEKFSGNKAKPLVNVFDLKPPQPPPPLTKSHILKHGIDECVWKFMVQNRGGWQNLLRLGKTRAIPLYTWTQPSTFLFSSLLPSTLQQNQYIKNISSSFMIGNDPFWHQSVIRSLILYL